ncbi:MAG: ATP-binding protein [Elusimicrobia bacterium]|nr:ATP-binding protein [Elusimicrobiota bacterium]
MRYLAGEIERLFREEKRMAFIAGPRQVGKTTLARRLLTGTDSTGNYFNWDNDAQKKAVLKRPDSFWTVPERPGTSGRVRVALDEIHKYPRWKRFLKGLYDVHGRDLELLVTGSGRLDIYQKGGDSLFGRYALYRLHPFTLGELLRADRETVAPPDAFWRSVLEAPPPPGADEGLATLERFTGFPEPLFGGSDRLFQRWRREHRRLVIREDLRDLTRIREIGLVESLLMLLPERIGSPLSINSLREDLSVSFDAAQNWIRALERLYYLFEIRPYSRAVARALRREGKVYLYDHTEIESPGARFENLVALHLRKLVDAWNDWGYGSFDLHYVRTKEKRETDFLIAESRKPYALIEAKLSGDTLDPALSYFAERLRPRFALQVVREGKAVRRSGVAWLIPAQRLLARI